MRMRRVVWLVAVAAAVVAAGTASAQTTDTVSVGAAVGYSTQFDSAVVSLDLPISLGPEFNLVPNGSFTESGGIHRWTAGLELQWNAPAHKLHPRLLAWLGGGMSAITEDPKGPADPTTRDLVINAVAGIGYDAPATPFIQVRVTLKDPTDVGLSIGVRF